MATNLPRFRFLFGLIALAPVACGDDGAATTDDTETDAPTSTATTGPGTASAATTTGATSNDATTSGTEDGSSSTGEPEQTPALPALIKSLVEQENGGTDVPGFPLPYEAGAGGLRLIPQLQWNLVAAFLDPLTDDGAPTAPMWGANNDFIAFLGDGWAADRGVPYFSGSGDAGWMWTNFEYISNDRASVGAAPQGQGRQLVTHLRDAGVREFQFDVTDDAQWTSQRVDDYIHWHEKMLGGALFRVERGDDGWVVDRSAANVRFDGTSNTLFRVTGPIDLGIAQDDEGTPLPANVVPGTSSNCSGGVTPWGTILSGEENTQFGYGEIEDCWSSANAFVPGGACDPGGDIVWNTAPSSNGDFTRGTSTNKRPDFYSYLVEIDPDAPPSQAYDATSGDGHQKLGSLGRAHWENATFAVGKDWTLVPDQPIVFYGGDDRRGGRVYKWVSNASYTAGMSKAAIRNMLADGSTYVAHFADLDNADDETLGAQGGMTVGGTYASASRPGMGQWIRLDVHNGDDIAPNAAGGAGSMTTVADALTDPNWNGMGAFPDQQTVLTGLYSASNKLGVRELNRPEDLEWNAVTGTLWIAFTNHGRPNALLSDGTLNLDDPGTPQDERQESVRSDGEGAIFVLVEDDPADPGASSGFSFYTAWRGATGNGAFDAANPDNLAIDSEGGVWFGTDGNFSADTQDGIYYLEVADDPTMSVAWRVASVPSDAEATGPWLSADERTLFFNVQHPQEDLDGAPISDFAELSDLGPRSGQVALSIPE